MEIIKKYENFPIRIVLLSNLVSLTIYGLGFLIIFRLGYLYALLFLLYILTLEFRLLKYHCTRCYYWGKICGFGKGKLSSWFFKKGDNSKFCVEKMTWKDIIPDILISLIPLITGIILLILQFDIILLSFLLLLILLTTAGNGYIRGSNACKYCKQKELGCPAEMLFNKER